MPRGKHQFGAFVRETREALGITRSGLAMATGWSRDVVAKIEQGTRLPTIAQLLALFDVLLIPLMYREQLVSLLYPGYTEQLYGQLLAHPTSHDLLDIASYPYPVAFMQFPAGAVLATSPSTPALFPGLVPGTSLIEWFFTRSEAEEIFIDWEPYAHGLAFGMLLIGKVLLPPERYAAVIESCARHPKWEALSTTPVTSASRRQVDDVFRLKPPPYKEVQDFLVRIDRPDFPRRPWATYRLIPLPPEERVDLRAAQVFTSRDPL